jgi:hypothetical protein
MKVDVKRQTPNGYCLFCEDIRYEQNGKFSLMGNFGSSLHPLNSFPLNLPKFCIYLSYFQRREDGFKDIRFEVVLTSKDSDQIIWESTIPSAALESAPKSDEIDESDDPLIGLHLPLEIHNFAIGGRGKIRVYANRGDERLRLGSLSIAAEPVLANQISLV